MSWPFPCPSCGAPAPDGRGHIESTIEQVIVRKVRIVTCPTIPKDEAILIGQPPSDSPFTKGQRIKFAAGNT